MPPSPIDVEAMGNDVGQKVLGRRLRPGEIPAFSQAFYAAFGNGQGGGGYESPGADTLSEAIVRSQMPVESEATDMVNAYEQFLQVMGGGRGR